MNALSLFNPRFTSDLFDALDRNFPEYMSETARNRSITPALPNVDVRETKDAYLLDMDLPGLTDKDVEINLKDRVLNVSSRKKAETEDKKEGEWLIHERRSMQFSRHFTLPDDIDTENVAASFKNGVLSITIPRRSESKARTIPISA
ncbi:MAG: Hsp20/alpha crystallin family protein [Bacteroides sp.]|nr:Hsp20/alpha crystallin family protein [Prevotella sp.]MCM1407512.1 Hsp20/alpha crystallin family protein [Treponema brennaborense]MCM1470002.1 Hsp20/alpha crystallin family protein [Bacteroides sp.]